MTRPERDKTEASTPDLDSLDAAWEDEKDENADAKEAKDAKDAAEAGEEEAAAEGDENLDDVDDGWETVPDPAGGPPQRRRVSPKERARRKRERQRAKAELAAKKQKGKKRGGPKRDDAGSGDAQEGDAEEMAGDAAESARPVVKSVRKPSASSPAVRRQKNIRTLLMIGGALVVAAVALYFMMASR